MKTIHDFKKYVAVFHRFYIVTMVLVAGMVLLFLLHSWNLAKQTYEHSRQWNREFISGEKLNELKENIEKIKSGEWKEGPSGQSLENMEAEYAKLRKLKDKFSKLKDGEVYEDSTLAEYYGFIYTWIKLPGSVVDKHILKDAGEYLARIYLFWFMRVLYALPVVYLLCVYFKYAGKAGEEYMRQLPFSQKQWYAYETAMGYLVSVLLPAAVSFLFSFIMKLAGYSVGDFLKMVLYLAVCATFNFAFIIMFKEFVRNVFSGVIWGTVVLLFLWWMATLINEGAHTYLCISQVVIVLISIAFVLIGYAVSSRYKLQDTHTISYLIVRLATVAILCSNMIYDVYTGTNTWQVVKLIFTLVCCYILVDLRYIADRCRHAIQAIL